MEWGIREEIKRKETEITRDEKGKRIAEGIRCKQYKNCERTKIVKMPTVGTAFDPIVRILNHEIIGDMQRSRSE